VLSSFPLADHGVRWIESPLALAHPVDRAPAAVLGRSVEATAADLGEDSSSYRRLMQPLVDRADDLLADLLGPARVPSHPLTVARFGLRSILPAASLARRQFRSARARALLAGLAAHSMLPLERRPSGAFGLVLGMLGHHVGWPFPAGGSQAIANGLASYLQTLGGTIATGVTVRTLSDLPAARCTLFDCSPRDVLAICGTTLPASYRSRLERYRYGPGAFKVDYALDGPIPWLDEACSRAATVHLGGTLDEIAAAERAVTAGSHPERPFVILAQTSLFDGTRAPSGKHTAWAYCHVPSGSSFDMSDRIDAQIERFAPGFRSLVVARHAMAPPDLERYNRNYVGGDINGGIQDLRQLFTRPVAKLNPYALPAQGLYLCSASTPPGGGVHGMCGYHAARAALRAPELQ
jgi:phytoene dehydrogenase-like protein